MKPREGALPAIAMDMEKASGYAHALHRYRGLQGQKLRKTSFHVVGPCAVAKTSRGKVKRIGDTGQENTATALLPFKLTSTLWLAFRCPLPRLAALATLLCPCLRRIRELVFEAAAFPPATPFAALRPV